MRLEWRNEVGLGAGVTCAPVSSRAQGGAGGHVPCRATARFSLHTRERQRAGEKHGW